MAHRALTYAWGSDLDIHDVGHALNADPGISHVAVVHHETTTGRLNELAGLEGLCRNHGVRLLIDAVSSFAAEALDFERWGIAGCAATANKCLHGAPGVSFVIVRRDQLSAAIPRTLYLDLATHCREQDRRSTPFTQPVQVLYALNQALIELGEQGGWQPRREQYQRFSRKVRGGLLRLGIAPLLAEEESSVVLSAYHLPNGMGYSALHDALKARGFIIYAGQGGLAPKIFRIAVMGAISSSDIDRLIDAFRAILKAK